jgi:hypothetical protein
MTLLEQRAVSQKSLRVRVLNGECVQLAVVNWISFGYWISEDPVGILVTVSACQIQYHDGVKTLHTPGSGRPSDVVVRSKARPFTGSFLFRVRRGSRDLVDDFLESDTHGTGVGIAAALDSWTAGSSGTSATDCIRRRLKRKGRCGMSFSTTRRNADRRSRPPQKLASSVMVGR